MKKNTTFSFLSLPGTVCILLLSVSSLFAQQENKEERRHSSDNLFLPGMEPTIGSDDFNNGLVYSFEQLINGKVAGVQVQPYGGSPNAGSRILIRGGASLVAWNNPLIVLDGFPLDTDGISGNKGNILSFLNPEDIESISVLKDAAATALYGARGADGVLLITTKRASGDEWKVRFKTTSALQKNTHSSGMLSAQQFKEVIRENNMDPENSLLGHFSTDWNDVIYRTAFATDNTLSITGRPLENLPLRASAGYYNQDGILKTDNSRRYSGSLSLFPSFLDNHLTFNVHLKGSTGKNYLTPRQAILYGARYNPTDPVYSRQKEYGGYYETIHPYTGTIPPGAIPNPLGVLEQTNFTNEVTSFISMADATYRMHFLPELTIGLSGAYAYEKGEGEISLQKSSGWYAIKGEPAPYGQWQRNTNTFFHGYLAYRKNLPEIKSYLEMVAGYKDQRKKKKNEEETYADDDYPDGYINRWSRRNWIRSWYAAIHYTYDSRYMLSLTMRRDGSSFFMQENHWQNFPAVSLGWRLSEEAFLKEVSFLNELKIKGSYGVSGKLPERTLYSYPAFESNSFQNYLLSFSNQYYQVSGTNSMWFHPDLKGETTTSLDAGLEIGLFNNRVNAGVNYYARNTKDIYSGIYVANGTNSASWVLTNTGDIKHRGIEVSLDIWPVVTQDVRWGLGANLTYQQKKVKKIHRWGNTEYVSVGNEDYYDSFQVLAEGKAPYTFSVYKQIYDQQGKPMEGIYEDFNDDNFIGVEDNYLFHSPEPDVILGFNTHFQYKKWELGMSFRAHTGNYVYNSMAASTGALYTTTTHFTQLKNIHKSYLETGFRSPQYRSSHYIENASFLKMDCLSLGYNFGNILKGIALNATATVQNLFTITNYSGTDPEVPDGIDSGYYPVPRIFSLSLVFDFN